MIGTLTKDLETTIHFTIVTTHGTKVSSKDIKVTWTKTTEEKTADAKIDVEKKAIDKANWNRRNINKRFSNNNSFYNCYNTWNDSKDEITIAKAGTTAPTTDEILKELGITKTGGLTIEIEGTLTKGSQTTIHFTIVTTHGTKVSSKNIKVTWTKTVKEIADAKIDVEKKAIDKAIDSKDTITIAKAGTVAPTIDEILEKLGITKTSGLTIEIEGTLTKGSQTTIHFTIVALNGTKVSSKDIKITWTQTVKEIADAKIDVEKKAIDKAIDSKGEITIAKAGTTAPTTDEILKELGITKTGGLTIEIEGTLTKGSQTTIHFTIVTTYGTKVNSNDIKVTWTKTVEEIADAKIDAKKKIIDQVIDSTGAITIVKAGTTAPTTDEILEKLGITKTSGLTIEMIGTLTKDLGTTIHFTIVALNGTKVSSKNIKVTWTKTTEEKLADSKKQEIDKAISKGEITIAKGGAEVLTIDEILEKLGITKTAGLTIEMIGTLKKDSATTIHFTITTKNGTKVNSKNIKVICVRNQFTKYKTSDGKKHVASKHDLSSIKDKNITVTQIGFETLKDGTAQVDNMPPGVINVPNKLPYGITSLKEMFKNCQKFNGDISNWNVSNITNMAYMFSNCKNFNQDLSNWNVSHVTNMAYMFCDCSYFTGGDISGWNVSNVTNMEYMFESCSFFFNQDLSNWNVSNVTNMKHTFAYCRKFNQDLSNWIVSKVTNMEGMLRDTSAFNQSLNSWDVSKVTNMAFMFHNSGINQPLNNWNVSNVINMEGMFWFTKFNKDISNWNVSNVKNHKDFLRGETSLEKNKTPKWK